MRYLTSSLHALRALGGMRCVFHPGAQGDQTREDAFARTKDAFAAALDEIEAENLGDLIVCPETMGKLAQIGTVDEVAALCNMGENVYPCVDFGHLNAREGGSLKTTADFLAVIDRLAELIGEKKTRNMHIHFSKIQYGATTSSDPTSNPSPKPWCSEGSRPTSFANPRAPRRKTPPPCAICGSAPLKRTPPFDKLR